MSEGSLDTTPAKANTSGAITIGRQLTDVKISNLIRDIGFGIAEAQFELDRTSMRIAQMMSGAQYEIEDGFDDAGQPKTKKEGPTLVKFGGKKYSMIELGFTPSFYQFVDTIIEVKMSISMTSSESRSNSNTRLDVKGKASVGFFSGSASLTATAVSASFASKYQYSAEGSSLVRTKLVPVPPPAILEERIRKLMDESEIDKSGSADF